MRTNKVLAVLLSLCMVFTMFGTTVAFAESADDVVICEEGQAEETETSAATEDTAEGTEVSNDAENDEAVSAEEVLDASMEKAPQTIAADDAAVPMALAADTGVSVGNGTMDLQSLGNLDGHPFSNAVRAELDWATYGYNSGVCWVNGAWASLSDDPQYANWSSRPINAWEYQNGIFSCGTVDAKSYLVYSMVYTVEGEGVLSFDYDVSSFVDGDTGYDYISGLVVIADKTVVLMKDGETSGTFSYEFNTEGQHTVTFLYNTYVETRYGTVIPDRHYAQISNLDYSTDPVAKITKEDGSEVNYFSLQSAVNASVEGDTITLLKDVAENIVSNNKSYTLDLNEKTVNGNKNGSVFRITGGTVTMKNGTLTGGYLTGSGNLGGGIYINNSATVVNLDTMTITGNHAYSGGGIAVYGGKKITISNSVISENEAECNNSNNGGGGGLYVEASSAETVLNDVDFLNNNGPTAAALYARCNLTATDCDFIGNSGDASADNTSIMYFTFGRERIFTSCNIKDNYGTQYTVELVNGTNTFNDCIIADNTAKKAGGIDASGGTTKLNNTVIKGNKAESNKTFNVGGTMVSPAGGILYTGGTLNYVSGAIYNNISATDANDLYVRSGVTCSILAADEMKDSEQDDDFFAEYVFREPNGDFVTDGLSGKQTKEYQLTAYNNTKRPVALYNDTEYFSIQDAVNAARDDDQRVTSAEITLIAGKGEIDESLMIFVSDPVEITIPVILNLNGCTPQVNKALAKDGVLFKVTGEGSLALSGKGTVTGGFNVEKSNQLILDAQLGEQDLDIKLGADDATINIGTSFDCSGKINLTLNADRADKLNNYNDSEEILDPLLLNGKDKIKPENVVLTNVTNRNVEVVVDGNNICAVNPKTVGVFMSGSGNNSNPGTFSQPVLTFEQAVQNLGPNGGTIYITGEPVKIDTNKEWDGDGKITVKRFALNDAENRKMILVSSNSTFTLKGITIDGGSELGYTNCGSMIDLGSGCTLRIEGGAVLQNNDISNTDTSSYRDNEAFQPRAGGAVYSSGKVVMAGGTIQNCTAVLGGGIFCYSGSFTMESGTFENNQAIGKVSNGGFDYRAHGGAVMINGSTTMKITGCEFKNNHADEGGGAISLGNSNTPISSGNSIVRTIGEKEPALTRSEKEEIKFTGNTAKMGGGVFIQGSYVLHVYEGEFTKNEARGGQFGGGAFYSNEGSSSHPDGVLYLENVLITKNRAHSSGGGIAGCGTSAIRVNIEDGSVIYDNTAGDDNKKDDILVATSFNLGNGGPAIKEGVKADHISQFMLDGTPYRWKSVTSGKYVDEDYLNSVRAKRIYTDATPSAAAESSIRVRITDNYSTMAGGGIGSNGVVIIGGESGDKKVEAEKQWEGLDEETKAEYPKNLSQLNMWLLRIDKNTKAAEYVDHQQLLHTVIKSSFGNSEIVWRSNVTFDHLPQDYDYIVLEEAILDNDTHVWSAEGKKYESVIKDIMNTMYPGTETWFWADAENSPVKGTWKQNADDSFSFSNKLQFGDLTVKKTVTGDLGDQTKEFNFTVTLNDKTINGTYGEGDTAMTFTDGVADFTLKHNESKTAKNLPAGTTYTVEEKEANQDDYITDVTGNEGEILADKTGTAAFVNNKEQKTSDPVGKLTVTKEVSGTDGETDREFHFTVTIGEDTYDIKLKDDGVWTSKDYPVGTAYSVTEKEANTDGYTTTVTGAEGKITETGSDAAVAAFENHRDKTEPEMGKLTVTKEVSGTDGETDREFNFTVTIGEDTYDIKLKDDGVWTSKDYPVGTAYSVTEKEANTDGYTTTVTGATGTISGDTVATAAFTNHKGDTPPSSGNGDNDDDDDDKKGDDEEFRNTHGDLKVEKTVTGNAGETERSFHFRVTVDDAEVDGVYGDMTFIEGVAEFTLKHGESKTAKDLPAKITYTVEEDEANQEGYTTTATNETGTVLARKTAAVQFVNAKSDDTQMNESNPPEKPEKGTPQTGDSSNVGLWIALAALSLGSIGAVIGIVTKRKIG